MIFAPIGKVIFSFAYSHSLQNFDVSKVGTNGKIPHHICLCRYDKGISILYTAFFGEMDGFNHLSTFLRRLFIKIYRSQKREQGETLKIPGQFRINILGTITITGTNFEHAFPNFLLRYLKNPISKY